MKKEKYRRSVPVAVIGVALIALILIFGTL